MPWAAEQELLEHGYQRRVSRVTYEEVGFSCYIVTYFLTADEHIGRTVASWLLMAMPCCGTYETPLVRELFVEPTTATCAQCGEVFDEKRLGYDPNRTGMLLKGSGSAVLFRGQKEQVFDSWVSVAADPLAGLLWREELLDDLEERLDAEFEAFSLVTR